jgi:hypothetical protein
MLSFSYKQMTLLSSNVHKDNYPCTKLTLGLNFLTKNWQGQSSCASLHLDSTAAYGCAIFLKLESISPE